MIQQLLPSFSNNFRFSNGLGSPPSTGFPEQQEKTDKFQNGRVPYSEKNCCAAVLLTLLLAVLTFVIGTALVEVPLFG